MKSSLCKKIAVFSAGAELSICGLNFRYMDSLPSSSINRQCSGGREGDRRGFGSLFVLGLGRVFWWIYHIYYFVCIVKGMELRKKNIGGGTAHGEMFYSWLYCTFSCGPQGTDKLQQLGCDCPGICLYTVTKVR